MPTDRLSFRDGYQFAWDSTSLTTFKECARKYYYKIVLGYSTRERSVHLDFGIFLHEAYELYHKFRAPAYNIARVPHGARDHEFAVREVVREMLVRTAGWESDDKYKNRPNLIRTIVWYLDERKDDPAQTVILSNGKPAVELSFRFEIPGTDFLYCGHMDRIASYQNDLYVFDYKSTKRALYTEYFDQYSPHNQMTGYTVGAKVTFHQPVKGVMIDAAQVGVGFSRFARGLAPRSEETLDEWLHDLGYWVKLAHGYAQAEFWPMNESSCDKYFGCEFRRVCAKSPGQRKTWLEADYTKRLWDPLQIRGDI